MKHVEEGGVTVVVDRAVGGVAQKMDAAMETSGLCW